MMIWTTRLTRKKAVLAVLGLGILMALAILLVSAHDARDTPEYTLNTNADRVEYLQSLGWDVEPEPLETLQLLLPKTLEEPYLHYNELQLAQGFDLSACCGKQVERCTYAVRNYPGRANGVQLNLYVCCGKPVAGDVSCAGKDGFQQSLVYPNTEKAP